METERGEGPQGDPRHTVPPLPNMANQSLHQSRRGGGEQPLSKTWKQERTGTNGGQRTHTHQLIFVKKLDEGGGNERVKSLQERIDLRLDGSRHPQLRHQLDVFSLRHTHTYE